MAEWFESWFGDDYVALYPHRDDADAERVVGLIARTIPDGEVRRVLDLACGAGRHSRVLSSRWWTAGIDLSEALLRLARVEESTAALVRGDMRILPFRDVSFDLSVNLFTSFGYFADDEDHRQVMMEVGRVTRPGGSFVLDYFNTEHLRRVLVPYDEHEVDGRIVEQRRSISEDGRFVIKHISVRGDDKRFMERVRLFDPADLAQMMTDVGFDVTIICGDYEGHGLTGDSPRAILFGTRR